jgi:hypothetical protein
MLLVTGAQRMVEARGGIGGVLTIVAADISHSTPTRVLVGSHNFFLLFLRILPLLYVNSLFFM